MNGEESSPKLTKVFRQKKRLRGKQKQEPPKNDQVLTLSVFLTPESSPVKDEDESTKDSSDLVSALEKPVCPPGGTETQFETAVQTGCEPCSDRINNLCEQHSVLKEDFQDAQPHTDTSVVNKIHPVSTQESSNSTAVQDKLTSTRICSHGHVPEGEACPTEEKNETKGNEISKSLSPVKSKCKQTLLKLSPRSELCKKEEVVERKVCPRQELVLSSPSLPQNKVRRGHRPKSQPQQGQDSKSSGQKSSNTRKKGPVPVQTNTITDYFPVRRSGRQTKSQVEKEKQELIERLILSNCEDGLKVHDFPNKGRGVVATKLFDKGDFVVEYAGDLLDVQSARQREQEYSMDPEIGCYMYFFSLQGNQYCVDATAESGRLGRLINHSRDGNCCTRALLVGGQPRLILVASRDVAVGEELSYDYGDRSKAALESHPWLKS